GRSARPRGTANRTGRPAGGRASRGPEFAPAPVSWSARAMRRSGLGISSAAFGGEHCANDGAPEGIRTPDPQIRSLVLYPAELPALSSGPILAGCNEK